MLDWFIRYLLCDHENQWIRTIIFLHENFQSLRGRGFEVFKSKAKFSMNSPKSEKKYNNPLPSHSSPPIRGNFTILGKNIFLPNQVSHTISVWRIMNLFVSKFSSLVDTQGQKSSLRSVVFYEHIFNFCSSELRSWPMLGSADGQVPKLRILWHDCKSHWTQVHFFFILYLLVTC